MSEKIKAIIVDLDGTMSNADHRKHHIEANNWDAFYEGLSEDPMNTWCDDIVFSLKNELRWQTIFVSGRPEKYRAKTEAWFKNQWGFEHRLPTSFKLFMRKDGDFRKDSIIKLEIYKEHIEPFYEIQFCIDDRKQVVDMWRSQGLVCLQCAEGNF